MTNGSDFEKSLEAGLKPGTSLPSGSYSESYKSFRAEHLSKTHTFYENACNFSKRFKVKVSDDKRKEINSYIALCHLNITPEGVFAFAYLTTFVMLLVATVSFFVFGLGLAGFILTLSLFALLLLPKIPAYIYNTWRAKASDQLVLAVLYMVIYMKRDANLESAILFVSQQLAPPVSLDFMKILWDVETKTYSTVRQSLESYVATWKEKQSAFVDSIHLIESSLTAPDESQAKSLLSKATDVILQGTQDNMVKYAHSLQGPVTMIHMLGIVLPILLLVMMPMVSAFMGDLIRPYHLFIGYNILLPILVFALVNSVIQLRPGGASTSDVEIYKKAKKKPGFKIGNVELKFPLKLIFAGMFTLFLIPPILYVLNKAATVETTTELLFADGMFYFSLFVIAGLGLSVALYYRSIVKPSLEQKHKTEKLEGEFAAAIFQLSSRIQENVPAEMAFGTVAEATKGTEVSEFFQIVDQNIRQRGMSLRDAIFDNKQGALAFFPSSTIRSVMNLLIEGVKKSPQAVAESLQTISTYLTDMHRVSERLQDLLAETISSIKMQASFLAAVISAIVVSLTVLVTKVLVGLGEQLAEVPTEFGGAAGAGPGVGIVQLFSVETATPPFLFQLIVGIYVIQVVMLLSHLLAGVIYGRDKIEARWMIASNLLIATSIYVVITLVASFFFSQLAGGIIG